MTLLLETIVYMLLAMLFTVIVDQIFYRKDFLDYTVLADVQRFLFGCLIFSVLNLFYTIIHIDIFLPTIINSLIVCIFYIYIFFMHTDLQILVWYEKIIFVTIALVSFISIYFGIEYILLLGSLRFVRIEINDDNGDCFNCGGECCKDRDTLYFLTDKEESKIHFDVTQSIREYQDTNLSYDDMLEMIKSKVGDFVENPLNEHIKLEYDL